MHERLTHRLLLAGLAFLLCLSFPVRSGLARDPATELKAAFLVRFSRYVNWPMETFRAADDPIYIGIMGRDPFGSAINRAARGFRARGRRIEIIRLQKTQDAGRCNILFIAENQAEKIDDIISRLQGRPILLVSDMDNFLNREGMIRFVSVENKIRFDINLANCRKNRLEISSKLLKIAHRVIK